MIASGTKRSPPRLVGAEVGWTLMVVGFLFGIAMVIAMQTAGSTKPDQDRTPATSAGVQSAEDRQHEVQLAEVKQKAEELQKQIQAFEEAKKLLTLSGDNKTGNSEPRRIAVFNAARTSRRKLSETPKSP